MLEKVKEMQKQGKPDAEIAQQLVDSGYPPREVQEAISQSKIKAAVVDEMQESVMSQENPMPEQYPQFQPPEQQEYPQEAQQYPQYTSYPEQQYPQEQYAQQPLSSETISEIASQVVEEKLGKVNKKISEFDDFKSIASAKLDNLNERLVKIERILADLNSAIIQRTGQYLEDVKNMKTEMGMMQDSMSKLVPSVVDSLKKIAGK